MNAVFMRRALAALTAVGILGAAFELFAERHWRSPQQLIPWVALALLAVAVLLLLLRDSPGLITAVRVIAVVVLLASAFGVYAHVSANVAMGSPDPGIAGYWQALTKTVGSAPPLAPGMLGQSALLLLLATLAGPASAAASSRHRRVPAGAE
ncbi:hypothetical protein [Nonomuraea sp. LPB2021202275-12-8]|uniref:hypothetical protein n=1 Tax=Nonomuraea sp. LPB2021202275-12-8 TaxID=3120159 RepID=UPI00300CC090